MWFIVCGLQDKHQARNLSLVFISLSIVRSAMPLCRQRIIRSAMPLCKQRIVNCQLSIINLFLVALNVCEGLSLLYLCALLCNHLNEFSAQCCGDGLNLSPWCLDVAERLSLVVVLSDERLDAWCALAVAVELVEYLSLDGCHECVCLGVLEC